MPVLYLDNFRGFNQTFLPLKNINFFVGENSTGKTSVLKLIKIVSDPRFWIMQDFNSEEAELGYYSEIASFHNPKKKYFEIGILGDHRDKEDGISAIKLRYVDNEGLPSLKEICMIDKTLNIQAIAENDFIKYRHSDINLDLITEGNKLKYFKKWIIESGLTNKAFIKKKLNPPFISQSLFFQLQTLIITELQSKLKKKKFSGGFQIPTFLQDVAWLAPIRTEPKRTYDSYKISFNPDGTHAPYLLKRLLGKGKSKEKVEKILEKFGADSGLFDKISINPLGKSETSPFELQVHFANRPLQITNVGYGVSQILPLIIEVIARTNQSWFAIQQPEIHLHPRAQAAFGDFIFKSYEMENKCFIVETHSDYTIDRFRLRLNKYSKIKKEKKDIQSQIVFFKKGKGGNELVNFPINQDGSLPDTQPVEFRDFFIKEQLDLIQI